MPRFITGCLVCLVCLFNLYQPDALAYEPSAPSAQPGYELLTAKTPQGQMVYFNAQSRKYHAPTCRWAIKCTKNCITLSRQEAIQRGGVPCKICGGG